VKLLKENYKLKSLLLMTNNILFSFNKKQNKTIVKIFVSIIFVCFFQTSFAQAPWSVTSTSNFASLPVQSDGAQLVNTIYHSKLLHQDIGFVIYLPASYFTSPENKFPLILNLHGANTRYFDYAGWSIGEFTSSMKTGMLPQTIVVYPNGFSIKPDGKNEGGAYWMDYYDPTGGTTPGKCETTIITELIPYLENTYRIGTKKENKAIVGFSMGGYGAVRFAMLSQKFGSCTSIDGALRDIPNIKNSGTKAASTFVAANNNDIATCEANCIHTIYAKNKAKARSVPFNIITSEGVEWASGRSWAPDAESLAAKMKTDGVTVTYKFIPNLQHNTSAFMKVQKSEIMNFIAKYLVSP